MKPGSSGFKIDPLMVFLGIEFDFFLHTSFFIKNTPSRIVYTPRSHVDPALVMSNNILGRINMPA